MHVNCKIIKELDKNWSLSFDLSTHNQQALELSFEGLPLLLLLFRVRPLPQPHVFIDALHFRETLDENTLIEMLKSLFEFLKSYLEDEVLEWVEWKYIDEVTQSAFKKALEKTGWSPPRLHSYYCRFETASFSPPWLETTPPIKNGFSASSGYKIHMEDIYQIERLIDLRGIPPYLSPFTDHTISSLPGSLFLKKGKKVIGWVITKQINTSETAFVSFYLLTEYRGSGLALPFLAEAIRRHKKKGPKWTSLEINVLDAFPSWFRFFKKRLVPLASYIEKNYYSMYSTPI